MWTACGRAKDDAQGAAGIADGAAELREVRRCLVLCCRHHGRSSQTTRGVVLGVFLPLVKGGWAAQGGVWSCTCTTLACPCCSAPRFAAHALAALVLLADARFIPPVPALAPFHPQDRVRGGDAQTAPARTRGGCSVMALPIGFEVPPTLQQQPPVSQCVLAVCTRTSHQLDRSSSQRLAWPGIAHRTLHQLGGSSSQRLDRHHTQNVAPAWCFSSQRLATAPLAGPEPKLSA